MTGTPTTSPTAQRLSVPPRVTRPPRGLTERELTTLLRIADCLIPATGPNPAGSASEDYTAHLLLALGARSDVFDRVMAGVESLADVPDDRLWAALKQLWSTDLETFNPLSSIVAGAYFMTPQIKALIGYPGQQRDPAPVDEAANEIDGLIDPVIERGPIYVPAD
jgi:hypothetical protein